MSALIIPCYLSSQWDIDCLNRLLDSVQSQSKPFHKVYLVDDASPLKFDPHHDFVEHIVLNENGGPARARNVGIDRALESGIQQLLFTDHDCVLDKDWNMHMTSFLSHTDYAAVGGMTYSLGKTIYDRYHDINGTLAGKWLLPERKELWYMPSLNFGMKAFAAQEFPFDERFPDGTVAPGRPALEGNLKSSCRFFSINFRDPLFDWQHAGRGFLSDRPDRAASPL